jgi:hypothetical protein
MQLKQNIGAARDNSQSDYHPGLVAWKPLEQTLNQVCMAAGSFPVAAMINSLKGILSAQDVNCLHNLRLARNKLVHHEDISLMSQVGTGITPSHFTKECLRLAARLQQLAPEEREYAHKVLITGNEGADPARQAWGRLVRRLRELTSRGSPFDCIRAFSEEAPISFIDRLHKLRIAWSSISRGETKADGKFFNEIDAVLQTLKLPYRLLLAKVKQEAAQTAGSRDSGASHNRPKKHKNKKHNK